MSRTWLRGRHKEAEPGDNDERQPEFSRGRAPALGHGCPRERKYKAGHEEGFDQGQSGNA
jgi:hypothetical protein